MSRQVYAHYMVGLTDGQSLSQWQTDIAAAQAVGIDGFALNIGPSDTWTLTQLNQAYAAAEAAGFTLFLSFDMSYTWTVDEVVSMIDEFKGESAQVLKNGLPMVSTFEGPDWSDNWSSVRSSTGGIFLVPCWTSIGPTGLESKLSEVDGAFSWAAWPAAGQTQLTDAEDVQYMDVLGSKPYMMGVSPYFYVNLPQYSKNWYSSSESLWYDRWQQALELLPDMIEIITWNDFSESSYIADIDTAQIVSGSEVYVDGFDHSAFRTVLPYFIAAYKAGNSNIALPSGMDPTAIAWYRTTPKALGSDGGTVWGQGGTQSASVGAEDVVSIMTVTVDETEVVVSIGGSSQTYTTNASNPVSFFEMPFSGLTGSVTLSMNGAVATGAAITNTLPSTGYVNFNSLAISV